MANRVRALRIYVDTSVVGGCLDEEFREASLRLFDKCRAGAATLVISDTLMTELRRAPAYVRKIIDDLPTAHMEYAYFDAVSEALAEEYLQQGAVPRKVVTDAQHIAVVTIARVDVVVSWNFKHIVNLNRIHAFNAVNLRLGYPMLEIRSPLEIWEHEDEDL